MVRRLGGVRRRRKYSVRRRLVVCVDLLPPRLLLCLRRG